jgi:16S rRNA (cytidine1402-2'-O)-methyltransferase
MANRKGKLRQGGSRVRETKTGRPEEARSTTEERTEDSEEVTPLITVVPTPIGNLGDLSPRSLLCLEQADFWVVEDTRVSGRLGQLIGIKKPMKIVNDFTGDEAIHRLLDEIETGKRVAIMSDGGAPGVSDPGSRLVDLAHERGILVDAMPGPSAVVNALMLSGFYAQRFAFLGFLGRSSGDIKKELEPFRESPYTLVLFESPHRFRKLLEVSAEVLGFRRYAICREISKINQQVFRSDLPTIPSEDEVLGRGEFTIVIEGRRKRAGV